jgi:ferredoxin
MKLVLDQTACQGYGLCSQEAPDLVDLDDWGYAGLSGDGTVPADRQSVAELAASACPVAALKLYR